ncbi:MAG: phenylphosphate carboxylase subunit delta [Zoogloeaceae bacterium]|jgi:3-deoxy-D-manno-octulosonate 8-phosphate phosphatase (KDO 8-P phosphatase)|nr:phenylphosphate carboxylase subunit delta [Zoogloeaceae bacterium]
MRHGSDSPAWRAAAKVRLMAFDVDGVMTDGRLWYDEAGREMKAFHALDGQGIRLLQAAGLHVAMITGRESGVVAARAANLGITHVFQGVADKGACFSGLLAALALSPEAAGFMGDDVIDLPAISLAAFSAAPPNAHVAVRRAVSFLTRARGGEGAVREVCDFLLAAQDMEEIASRRWQKMASGKPGGAHG